MKWERVPLKSKIDNTPNHCSEFFYNKKGTHWHSTVEDSEGRTVVYRWRLKRKGDITSAIAWTCERKFLDDLKEDITMMHA